MYEYQHEQSFLKYEELNLQIDAYTLEGSGEPDVVSYSMSFYTTDKDIYCHSVGLSQAAKDSGSFKQSEITLYGPDQKVIAADYLPMADPATPEKREILLFFDRVLPANSGPYTLTIRDVVKGLMSDLLNQRQDVFFTRCPRTSQPIGRIREVLSIPGNFKNARMVPAEELEGKQVPGRAMTPSELLSFQSPRPGWISLGWVGENVQPEVSFGPSIQL